MNDVEKARFTDALSQAAKMLELAQSQLQRARSQSAGELYDRVDLISKRVFELKVKTDWLRYSVLGKVEDTTANGRVSSDRRVGIDRRLVGMQKKLLSVA